MRLGLNRSENVPLSASIIKTVIGKFSSKKKRDIFFNEYKDKKLFMQTSIKTKGLLRIEWVFMSVENAQDARDFLKEKGAQTAYIKEI